MLFMQKLTELLCYFFTHFLYRSDLFLFLHHRIIKLFLELFGESVLNIDLKLIERLLQVINQRLNNLI
jgi:hypothetical protein